MVSWENEKGMSILPDQLQEHDRWLQSPALRGRYSDDIIRFDPDTDLVIIRFNAKREAASCLPYQYEGRRAFDEDQHPVVTERKMHQLSFSLWKVLHLHPLNPAGGIPGALELSGGRIAKQLHDDDDQGAGYTPKNTEYNVDGIILDIRPSDISHEIEIVDKEENEQAEDRIDDDLYRVF
jgi:hypothetical protein